MQTQLFIVALKFVEFPDHNSIDYALGWFPIRKTFLRRGTHRKVSFVFLAVPVLRKINKNGNQP